MREHCARTTWICGPSAVSQPTPGHVTVLRRGAGGVQTFETPDGVGCRHAACGPRSFQYHADQQAHGAASPDRRRAGQSARSPHGARERATPTIRGRLPRLSMRKNGGVRRCSEGAVSSRRIQRDLEGQRVRCASRQPVRTVVGIATATTSKPARGVGAKVSTICGISRTQGTGWPRIHGETFPWRSSAPICCRQES